MDAADNELSISEYRALARVVETRGITPKALAASMSMSTALITELTDRLLVRGLAQRVPNLDDRRSVILQPTADGQAIVESIFNVYRGRIADAALDSTDEQIEVILAFLDRLTNQLAR